MNCRVSKGLSDCLSCGSETIYNNLSCIQERECISQITHDVFGRQCSGVTHRFRRWHGMSQYRPHGFLVVHFAEEVGGSVLFVQNSLRRPPRCYRKFRLGATWTRLGSSRPFTGTGSAGRAAGSRSRAYVGPCPALPMSDWQAEARPRLG